MAVLESDVYDAYKKERSRSCGGVSENAFPIALLVEWDKARRKLNPNATLSYAEKLLLAGSENE